MSDQLYSVARPFQYGPEGAWLDVGQVTALRGQPNDELMKRTAFFREFDGRKKPYECGKCGGKFIDMNSLNAHGQLRHEGLSAMQLAAGIAAAAASATAEYPLNMENTTHGRRARA